MNFYFSERNANSNTVQYMSMFNRREDWINEIQRCGAEGWHVLSFDRDGGEKPIKLPIHIVIPKKLTESEYLHRSRFFRNERAAIWVNKRYIYIYIKISILI